jgi:hypothetical protein
MEAVVRPKAAGILLLNEPNGLSSPHRDVYPATDLLGIDELFVIFLVSVFRLVVRLMRGEVCRRWCLDGDVFFGTLNTKPPPRHTLSSDIFRPDDDAGDTSSSSRSLRELCREEEKLVSLVLADQLLL